MSTYKALVGKKVKSVSSDPSDSADGQMWYNTTTQSLRGLAVVEAFSSGANTINSKQRVGGCGTQDAGLACGGLSAPPDPPGLATTEEYNGTGWTAGGTLNTARGNTALIGTQTAAVFSGKGSPGTPYAGTTELYNGTAWTTNPNSAPDTYNYRSSCGTQTAGLLSGGNYPPTNRGAGNEHFDGTSFSEGGDLPQKQSSSGQAGTQTAAINSFGATNSPVPGNSGDADNAISLEYDGTSWTAGPNGNGVVPLSGYDMGAGTQTDALFVGGPPTNSCKYDGTTFTVGPALATAQPASAHGSASASATWVAHGSPIPSVGNKTQEFNRSTNTVTAAAWSSGGNLNNARDEGASSQNGLQTAALYFGGYYSDPAVAYTEQYDGSSWTAKNALNTARYSGAGAGTTTAALYSGGFSNPSTRQSAVEEWDGTNWASQPYSLGTGRNNCGGCGTQTAALVYGGDEPADSNKTELYNGTSWTNGGALSTARSHVMGGVGISTAAICVGGKTPGSNFVTTTEEYGGSSWTSGGTLITGSENGGGAGTATDAIIFGGATAPGSSGYSGVTQGYDGTAFSTRPSLATSRNYVSGTGTSTAGVAFGGNSHPTYTTATEEFTGETTAANVETFSTS